VSGDTSADAPLDVARLRALAEEATPGPWEVAEETVYDYAGRPLLEPRRTILHRCDDDGDDVIVEGAYLVGPNADLIVAMRNDVARLCAAYEARGEALRECLREAVDTCAVLAAYVYAVDAEGNTSPPEIGEAINACMAVADAARAALADGGRT